MTFRLLEAGKILIPDYDSDTMEQVGQEEALLLRGRVDGIQFSLEAPLPDNWDDLDRSEKIAWGKSAIADHLTQFNYTAPEPLFPDRAAPDAAREQFENLPGWATWTGQEAAQWVEDNVTDLASAKIALKAMGRAIMYLRDIVIER